MSTLPRERVPLKPVRVTGAWLLKPIAPCEIMPQGFPGVLLINSRPYLCSIIGELPEHGEPVCRGYQLVKDDGTVYHVDTAASWGGWECDCPDSVYRGGRPGGCRHCVALRQALGVTEPPHGPAARVSAA